MSFQPFGYRFEISSPMRSSELKAVIRSRKKRWRDRSKGARGWIAGPFLCLWFSSLNREGPMLFGFISEDGSRTRVRGRAGSDLNGNALLTILILLWMLFGFLPMLADNSAPGRKLLVISLLMLVAMPWFYWSAHKDRRQAEPLVRFLQDAVTEAGRTRRSRSERVRIPDGFRLIRTDGGQGTVATSADMYQALLELGANDLVVLESSPGACVQAAFDDGGYVLGMQQRNGSRRYRAIRRRPASAPAAFADSSTFTFDEALSAFLAYGCGTEAPEFMKWERIELAP